MDASLKNVHSLSPPEWKTDYSLTLKFQICTFQIHPAFNIITVSSWLIIYIPLLPNKINS